MPRTPPWVEPLPWPQPSPPGWSLVIHLMTSRHWWEPWNAHMVATGREEFVNPLSDFVFLLV